MHGRNPRRLRPLLLSLAVLGSACGGATPPEEAPPPPDTISVTSDDGLLTVEAPADAVPDGVEISIAERSGEEIPELAEAGLTGSVYELEPDGAEFSEPVTVSKLVDPEAIGADLEEGMPVPLLALRGSEGGWEWAEDQEVAVGEDDPSKVRVSGTTTHFSTAAAFGTGLQTRLTLGPAGGTYALGQTFSAEVTLTFDGKKLDPESVEFPSGGLDFLAERKRSFATQTYGCERAGSGTLRAEVDMGHTVERAVQDLVNLLAPVGEIRTTTLLTQPVACSGEAPPEKEEPRIRIACATWVHDAFRRWASTVAYFFGFTGVDPGAAASVTAAGVNDEKPLVEEIEGDGSARFTGGIDATGPHPPTKLEVTTADGETHDLTKQAKRALKGFEVGGDHEGEFGDCGAF